MLNHLRRHSLPPAVPLVRVPAFRALLRSQVASPRRLPQILLGTVLAGSWQYGSELDDHQLVLFTPRRMVCGPRCAPDAQTDAFARRAGQVGAPVGPEHGG